MQADACCAGGGPGQNQRSRRPRARWPSSAMPHLRDRNLHLLFGCPVPVPDDGQHTAQLQVARQLTRRHARCATQQQRPSKQAASSAQRQGINYGRQHKKVACAVRTPALPHPVITAVAHSVISWCLRMLAAMRQSAHLCCCCRLSPCPPPRTCHPGWSGPAKSNHAAQHSLSTCVTCVPELLCSRRQLHAPSPHPHDSLSWHVRNCWQRRSDSNKSDI